MDRSKARVALHTFAPDQMLCRRLNFTKMCIRKEKRLSGLVFKSSQVAMAIVRIPSKTQSSLKQCDSKYKSDWAAK